MTRIASWPRRERKAKRPFSANSGGAAEKRKVSTATSDSNLDHLVRQFVAVQRAGREVPGQLRAAQLDGGHEAVPGTSVLDRGNHCCNGLRPCLGLHLGINSAVGNDLGIALRD